MPIYEYKCKKCGKTSSFLEKIAQKKFFFSPFQKKCPHCRKRALVKTISSFSAHKSMSQADTLNEISKMAPINFVPQSPRPTGPPSGGCPYAQEASKKES